MTHTLHTLFSNAMARDEAYSAAIRAAYGPKASRWDAGIHADLSVALAYRFKVEADEAYASACRAARAL